MRNAQPLSQSGHLPALTEMTFQGCHSDNGSGASTQMQARLPDTWKGAYQNPAMPQRLQTRQRTVSDVPKVALGQRLRDARKRAGLTQEQVGAALELDAHSAVGRWERGTTQVQTVNLILAAQLYNESLDWLVFGMKGTLEKRIASLPESLRDLTMSQITAALESAERAAKTHPQLFGGEYVADADPRLTRWSAKDKPKRKSPAGKIPPRKGTT